MKGLEDLANTENDVIIGGGGMIGAFIFRDCAMRGLNPVLVERNDFGGETTSASSRFGHGGVRYLSRIREWGLVFESLRERDTLKWIAPHIVRDMGFVLPIYDRCIDFPLPIEKAVESGLLPAYLRKQMHLGAVSMGMSIYELMPRLASQKRGAKKHRFINTPDIWGLLNDKDLLGTIQYIDSKIDSPERLALEAVLQGEEYGGLSFNYSEVIGFEKARSGKVTGIIVQSGKDQYRIRGKLIINATGPQIDLLNKMHTTQDDGGLLLRVGGIHAAVPYFSGCEKLDGNALVVPAVGEESKRVVFVVPEDDHCVIGTTETKLDDGKNAWDYRPSCSEIECLFESVKRIIPKFDASPEDIIYSYAGVRPLKKHGGSLTRASRKDLFHHDEKTGIISVSGKLTPARALAERVTDLASMILGNEGIECKTAATRLYGGEEIHERPQDIAQRHGLTEKTALKLLRTYGSRYKDVVSYCDDDPQSAKQIGGDGIEAQVLYAVDHEKARTIADVMLRRTGMGKRAGFGLDFAARVGELMASRLGWSANELENEIEDYRQEVGHRYVPV